jgi:hypothetical protein
MMTKPLPERVRLGVLAGMAYAFVYSLFAWAVFNAKSIAQVEQMGATLAQVIVAYWAGAVLGGGLVGAFLPVGRRPLGAFGLGTLGALPFFLIAFLVIASDAPWLPDQVVMALIASLVVGGSLGLYIQSNSKS